MAKEKTKTKDLKKENKKKDEITEIILNYNLYELPSAQHKAGLAGFVIMIKWLKNNKKKYKGLIEEIEVSSNKYSVKINKEGLKSIFDETYSASWAEQERNNPIKNKKKEIVPWKYKKKIEIKQTENHKQKAKEKEIYVYDVVVPYGSFLSEWDNSNEKIWIKLWRDMVWQILRGIPLTRIVYENRANKIENKDYSEMWESLTGQDNKKSSLKSSYFIGSQDKSSDGISFLDRVKNLLLLHFWPFIVQIYIPQKIEYDKNSKTYKTKDDGFILSIPDIIDLENFILDYEEFMRQRDNTAFGIRPKHSRILISDEAAWEFLQRIRLSISKESGYYEGLINAIEIYHLLKEGNNINIKSLLRIKPEVIKIKEYEAFKNSQYFDPVFRKQVLINISKKEIWYNCFIDIFNKYDYKYFLGNKSFFAHDVRNKFYNEYEILKKEEKNMEESANLEKEQSVQSLKTLEQIVFEMSRKYISAKLNSKYNLGKESVNSNEYNVRKEKLAKEAFLAVRSRTGEDFINYFSSTICSVGQYMNEERYLNLTKALFEETEKVRTLTMLALSAASYTYQKKEN